jgi:putative intracellular protease/amidase
MNILMVLTSHFRLGNTEKLTGYWLEEFAAPYYVFKDAGADVMIASPMGGKPPLDPKSDEPSAQTEATRRFKQDAAAQNALANTTPLKNVSATGFDAVFYPGGHGPMWDLTENAYSIKLIEAMLAAHKTVAAVCHAPSVFRHVKDADGNSVVKNKRVTGFSNSEENTVGLSDIVPFLLEDMLVKEGAQYSKGPDWEAYVVTDGLLVTGQNPASSELVASTLLKKLRLGSIAE